MKSPVVTPLTTTPPTAAQPQKALASGKSPRQSCLNPRSMGRDRRDGIAFSGRLVSPVAIMEAVCAVRRDEADCRRREVDRQDQYVGIRNRREKAPPGS